ncbi:MAG: 50S ribosomal protein L29 [Abditibacteriota bacterium]|nr:50S ribosomal protein L29 [Abditibacteriota bacterium]
MLSDERKNLFTLRQKKAFRQLDNVHAIPEAKKNIARIITEIRARELKG